MGKEVVAQDEPVVRCRAVRGVTVTCSKCGKSLGPCEHVQIITIASLEFGPFMNIPHISSILCSRCLSRQ